MREQMSLENIDPTVFIGLGGAGGHVLGRISRIFHEEFGSQIKERGGASPLQFLLLDSDDFEKLPKQVRENLGNREEDFLSLSHFNPRRYAERQRVLPDSDLPEWLDPAALPFFEDGIIRDGASRLRMLGRLCLHYHYREVEQRVRQKLERAADADVQSGAARVRPEPRPLRVFIVSSSCGGTGSATFLDIAGMVNRLARDRGITPSITGFVFLPFAFIEANAQIDPALERFYRDNAWAFFEELNHVLLHPSQFPRYALNLERASRHKSSAGEYGNDLFRTVFLLDNHIPTVGTLELSELYAYAAHGIFHVFLTPEEGAVQSHYSNIKTKLSERDRVHGQMKRFATFGYAEYRLHPDRLVHRLAHAAVNAEFERLKGSRLDPKAVEQEAARLEAKVDAEIVKQRELGRKWTLMLPVAATLVEDAENEGDLLRSVGQPVAAAQAQLNDAQQKKLPALEQLAAQFRNFLVAELDERLADPLLGVVGEQEVLKRVRERIEQTARALRPASALPQLNSDPALIDLIRHLGQQPATIWRKRLPFVPASPAPKAMARFTAGLDELMQELQKGAHLRYAAELDERIAGALEEVAGELGQRMSVLERLAGELSQPDDREAEASTVDAPTIREFPPAAVIEQVVNAELEGLRSTLGASLRADYKRLWAGYHVRDREQAQSASELRDGLEQLWRKALAGEVQGLLPETVNPLRDEPALPNGAETGSGDPYRALFPMSFPPCPLDTGSLHQADTVARIPVVVWPWAHADGDETMIGKRLRLPWVPQVCGAGSRKRVAVLQAWYGFSSRALEGMETLRRSYLERHRATSLPHIHAEWNDRGVGCAADSLARLSNEDVLLVARALALSHQPTETPKRKVELPGMRIVRDERDTSPFYLLMYDHNGGHTRLRWRDLRPVEGHRQTWEMVYNGDRGWAETGTAVHAPAGIDLERDLSAYLASEVRSRHAQFLAGLDVMERNGNEQGEPYLHAYREYLTHLDSLIHDEEARGRERHLPVLHRLSDALHRHVRGLTLDESRPL